MVYRFWLAVALLLVLTGQLGAQADSLEVIAPAVPDPDLSLVYRDDLLNLIALKDRNAFPQDFSVDYSRYIQQNPSGYYEHLNQILGLNSEIPHLKYHGFEVPASAFNRALYLANQRMYHDLVVSGYQTDATQQVYPYPMPVSRLTGSLGDYDNRYVNAMLAKSEVFGWRSSALRFDFTAQNSYWADTPASLSAMRFYGEAKLAGLDFALDYSSYKREASMYELLPQYWQNVNFPLSHDLQQWYLAVSYARLKLSYLNTDEQGKSAFFAKALSTQSKQIAVENQFEFPSGEALLRYEYADIERNYTISRSYNLESYQHLLGLDLNAKYPLLLNVKAELFDWKRIRSGIDLGLGLGSVQTGAYARLYSGADEPLTSVTDIFAANATMPVPYIHSPSEYGLYGLYEWANLSAKLTAGMKRSELSLPSGTRKEDLLVAHLAAKWNPHWGVWELLVQPVWNYQQYSQNLMEAPEFSFRSDQVLTRHLEHHNALSLGLSLYGHSEFYAANVVMPYLIEGSTLVDVWVGVRITRQFDFAVSLKNLFDSALYAVNPVPVSFHAALKWYFLN